MRTSDRLETTKAKGKGKAARSPSPSGVCSKERSKHWQEGESFADILRSLVSVGRACQQMVS